MTAHKHAKMIKAKADNMELVVFIEIAKDRWQTTSSMPDCEDFEYFLCLPQHKSAVLAGLNGSNLEYLDEDVLEEGGDGWRPVFIHEWEEGYWYMRMPNLQIRIKPRKEKLWLAVKTDKHEHLGGCRKVRICSHAFVNKTDAEEYLDLTGSQLIEIEVEV